MENWPQWAKNMAGASRITGMSRTTLAGYKRDGADGFKSDGRIDLHALRDWMLANGREAGQPSTELQAARIRLLAAQSEKVEMENAVRRKDMISFAEVRTGIHEAEGVLFTELERIFTNDLPSMCKGMDEMGIRQVGKKQIEVLKNSLRERFTALIKQKAQNEETKA